MHTKANRPLSSPPIGTDLLLTNIKIQQHTPKSPLATAHSALQTWSSTGVLIPNSSKHTTLFPCTKSHTTPIGMNVIDERAIEGQLCATSVGDAMFDLRRGGDVI